MEREQIIPKSYPVNLLNKDWSKRKLYFKCNSKKFIDQVHDLEVRDDDVWLVTNPKCGTTWMQELLWLLMNDLDYDRALSTDLEIRSPFMEFDYYRNGDAAKAIRLIQQLPVPRLIKSHLPLALLPAQLWQRRTKVVYVARNPLDAWISSYYHGVTFGFQYGKTLENYIDEYVDKIEPEVKPIEHAVEFYQLRHEPWLFYTSFEQMKSNLRGVIEDVCKLLNKTITDEQMERLLKHLSFEEMKKNPTVNHLWERQQIKHENVGKEVHNFIRRGKVNGYKDELKPEQIERANLHIQKKLEECQVTLDELLLLK